MARAAERSPRSTTRFQPNHDFKCSATALLAAEALSATPARAADCSQGSADEKLVCLNQKVVDLEAKLAELTKDALEWNDRISLVRDFPSDGAAIVLSEGDNRKDATTE